jgi:hypothetical protein
MHYLTLQIVKSLSQHRGGPASQKMSALRFLVAGKVSIPCGGTVYIRGLDGAGQTLAPAAQASWTRLYSALQPHNVLPLLPWVIHGRSVHRRFAKTSFCELPRIGAPLLATAWDRQDHRNTSGYPVSSALEAALLDKRLCGRAVGTRASRSHHTNASRAVGTRPSYHTAMARVLSKR